MRCAGVGGGGSGPSGRVTGLSGHLFYRERSSVPALLFSSVKWDSPARSGGGGALLGVGEAGPAIGGAGLGKGMRCGRSLWWVGRGADL